MFIMVAVKDIIVPSTPGGMILPMIMKLGTKDIILSIASINDPVAQNIKTSEIPKYLNTRKASIKPKTDWIMCKIYALKNIFL